MDTPLSQLLENPGLLPASCVSRTLGRGDVLFRQGETGGSLFLVRSGRLRILRESSGGLRAIGEIYAGEVAGEVGLLDPAPCSSTAVALRPTEVLEVRPADFEIFMRERPAEAFGLLRLLVARWRRLSPDGPARRTHPPDNLVVVAGGSFAEIAALRKALASHGPTTGLSPGNTSSFPSRLAELEAENRFVVAHLDEGNPEWRDTLLRFADIVLVWGEPTAELGALGQSVESALHRLVPALVRPRLHAVFRHTSAPPYRGAEAVLAVWPVAEWHHVRKSEPASLARLARVLGSEEVSLVLGGGGARGLSHLGVIQELADRGIPVDRISGTSIGALVGALWALHRDSATVAEQLRHHLAAKSGKLHDFTLPVVSFIGARRYTKVIRKMFGDELFENFPTDFHCVSCNLTQGVAVVHDTGLAWDWIVTSMSLPGFAPPRLVNGELLTDGGVLENLPTRQALRRARGPVIAVDLKPSSDLRCNPALSGRRHGLRAWRHGLPKVAQILRRASVVQGDQLRPAALGRADLAIQPEVGQFGMFDWHRMDEIVAAGRDAARKALDQGWPLAAPPGVST